MMFVNMSVNIRHVIIYVTLTLSRTVCVRMSILARLGLAFVPLRRGLINNKLLITNTELM